MFATHIISNLRFRLAASYSTYDVDAIADSFSEEINLSTLDIVKNYTDSAINYAYSIGAKEFVHDINIIEKADGFEISTLSGKTDFSIPEIKNLPNLLKNGKTGKDGNVYKKIPMKKKRATTSMQQAVDTNLLQGNARAQLVDKGVNSTNKITAMVESFSQQLRNQVRPTERAENTTVDSFRTASSKQDPNTSWVIPKKDMDMTSFLRDLNHSMAGDIANTISSIIEKYEREYL